MTRIRSRSAVLLILAVGAAACDVEKPFRVLSDDRTVERVRMTPETISAAIRDTIQLTATAIGTDDREITEAAIVWSSGDPSIARSIGDGRYVIVSSGTAEVFATSRGRRAGAVVTAR